MAREQTFHILHIIASLKGGAAIHLSHLSHGLLRKGHYVSVASPQDNVTLKMLMESSGCMFHDIPMDTKPWTSISLIKKAAKKHPYTHIHVHGHRAAYIARKALKKDTLPLIYTVHGYHPAFYNSGLYKWYANRLEQTFEKHTDTYIAVSQSTKDKLIEAVPAAEPKTVIINNAIPRERVSPEEAQALAETVRRELRIHQDRKVVGTVSRLHWQKGVDRLIEAHEKLIKKGAKHLLLIIGDGPEREKLEALCQNKGLNDYVKFTGHRSEARRMFYAMDIFALASNWEGHPLTILEAWDTGVPVVVPKVPGCMDMINDGHNGLCVENTSDALADGIESLLTNTGKANQLVQQGWKSFDNDYPLENMIDANENIYKTLASRAG